MVPNKFNVWRYFGDDLDGQFAQCLLCKYHPVKGVAVYIKAGGPFGGSTQALINHLRWHHQKEFLDMENEEGGQKKQKNPLGLKESVTPKIGHAFRKLTKIDPQGKKQSNFEKNKIITDQISSQMTKTGIHLQIGKREEPEYACKLCPKRGLATNVFMHIQQTHQGNNTGQPLTCKCGKNERSKYAMMTHVGKMHARKQT